MNDAASTFIDQCSGDRASELLSKVVDGGRPQAANLTPSLKIIPAITSGSNGLDIRSNKVLFYFVPQSNRYDLELGDAMTALEVELGGSAGIGYVETLQVPERSLDRFAGKKSLLVWRHEAAL